MAVEWFLCEMGKIKYCTGFKERGECLDENKSLRLTTILVWNSRERSVTEEMNGRQHWKRIITNFGTVNEVRKVKERQKVRESGIAAVEVEEKGWNVTKKVWYMTTTVWITPWLLAEVDLAFRRVKSIIVQDVLMPFPNRNMHPFWCKYILISQVINWVPAWYKMANKLHTILGN